MHERQSGRPRSTTCRQGHDLTDPNNVYTVPSTGKRSCRECNREHRRAFRKRKRSGQVRHMVLCVDTCTSCGREKWSDSRKLCFGCSMRGRRSGAGMTEQALSDKVAIESAPAWVRQNPREHRRWLEARKLDVMRQR